MVIAFLNPGPSMVASDRLFRKNEFEDTNLKEEKVIFWKNCIMGSTIDKNSVFYLSPNAEIF